jgi:hypothetical protein
MIFLSTYSIQLTNATGMSEQNFKHFQSGMMFAVASRRNNARLSSASWFRLVYPMQTKERRPEDVRIHSCALRTQNIINAYERRVLLVSNFSFVFRIPAD